MEESIMQGDEGVFPIRAKSGAARGMRAVKILTLRKDIGSKRAVVKRNDPGARSNVSNRSWKELGPPQLLGGGQEK